MGAYEAKGTFALQNHCPKVHRQMNGEGEKLTEKSISVSSRTISYATQATSTTTLSGWVLEFRSI